MSTAALLACGSDSSGPCAVGVATAAPRWQDGALLTERWRIEGHADDRELLLPASVAVDAVGGRIAIIDFGLGEIIVAGLDGRWIGRWGRKGRGPGEVTAPMAAAWRPGSTLSVLDPANSRIVLFDSAGTAIADEPVESDFTTALGGGAYWILLAADGSLLAHPVTRGREGEIQEHTIIWKKPGRPVETLVELQVPSVEAPRTAPVAAPGWPRPQAAMGADGELAIADTTGSYRIDFRNSGRPRRSICRDVDPRPIDDTEIVSDDGDIPPSLVELVKGARRPDLPASIGRLLIDSDERLWVQRDRPRALSAIDATIGREGALHDVFSSDGGYMGEVMMPENVRLIAAVGDLLIGLYQDDLDVYSVVGYSLPPDFARQQP